MGDKIKIYCPVNLTRESLPKKLQPFFEDMAWICHCIHTQRIFTLSRYGVQKFVNLQTMSLRNIISWRVLPVILRKKSQYGYLLNKGILISDDEFNAPTFAHQDKPAKCYGYRFGDKYSNVHKIEIEDAGLVKRISDYYEDRYKELTTVHKFLYNKLKDLSIDIDITILPKLPIKDIELTQIAVQMILDECYRLKIDEYGRVHTNITNIPKCIRKYLKFKSNANNSNIVNIDISNSQPLLLTLSTDSIVPYNSQESDVELYYKLCKEGTLYEYLMNLINWTQDKNEFKKRIFFSFLYGNPKETESARTLKRLKNQDIDPEDYKTVVLLTQVFMKTFPNIYKVIKEGKSGYYKDFSRRMQRNESDIMINRVCTRIMNECPEAPCVTIHDSILTTEEYSDTIKTIIEQEWAAYGLYPTVRVEPIGE